MENPTVNITNYALQGKHSGKRTNSSKSDQKASNLV